MTHSLRAWKTMAPRRLFLVDGLGAALSAVALGAVLPSFAPDLGLPAPMLYLLAGLAGGLAAGAWGCWWANPANGRPWLQRLAGANLLYAGLTAALLSFGGPTLTAWGGLYFGLELTVVTLLAGWELHTAARLPS